MADRRVEVREVAGGQVAVPEAVAHVVVQRRPVFDRRLLQRALQLGDAGVDLVRDVGAADRPDRATGQLRHP
jgi:hypothetical protein